MEPFGTTAVAAALARRLDPRNPVFTDGTTIAHAALSSYLPAAETPENRLRAAAALWSQANTGSVAAVEWLAAGVPAALQRSTIIQEREDAAHQRRTVASSGRTSAPSGRPGAVGRGRASGVGVSRRDTAVGDDDPSRNAEWPMVAARLWRLCVDGAVFPEFAAFRMRGRAKRDGGRSEQLDADDSDADRSRLLTTVVTCLSRVRDVHSTAADQRLGAYLGVPALGGDGDGGVAASELPPDVVDQCDDVLCEALQVWFFVVSLPFVTWATDRRTLCARV